MSPVDAARRRGVGEALLGALAAVDRRPFVLPEARERAHLDVALPIGGGHLQAEPSILAHQLSLAGAGPGRRVLCLGAGSGYVCALAAAAGAAVVGIEREPILAAAARARGLDVRDGDAYDPLPVDALDGIVVGGAVASVERWLASLADGGVLVAPTGDDRRQELITLRRDGERFERRGHGAVRFAELGRPR